MKQTWQIKFKKKCIDAGINSKKAAAVMGVSQSHLSEVLTGKKLVGPGLALKLERGFGLSALTILTGQARELLKRERAKAKSRERK